MNTFTKELKQMIGMVTACISIAFVALVALFVRAGGMDKLGTSVLMLVLVAFVAVGIAVIVDEYHAEQRREIARAHWYELDAVRYMRDEYADTLAMVQADNRDDVANVRKLSTTVMEQLETIENLQARIAQLEYMNDTNYKQNEKLKAQRDELAEELDEIRYTIHAEQNRLADI
jgi:septal ring factor EnvC (AmiA/AmiB activator)